MTATGHAGMEVGSDPKHSRLHPRLDTPRSPSPIDIPLKPTPAAIGRGTHRLSHPVHLVRHRLRAHFWPWSHEECAVGRHRSAIRIPENICERQAHWPTAGPQQAPQSLYHRHRDISCRAATTSTRPPSHGHRAIPSHTRLGEAPRGFPTFRRTSQTRPTKHLRQS